MWSASSKCGCPQPPPARISSVHGISPTDWLWPVKANKPLVSRMTLSPSVIACSRPMAAPSDIEGQFVLLAGSKVRVAVLKCLHELVVKGSSSVLRSVPQDGWQQPSCRDAAPCTASGPPINPMSSCRLHGNRAGEQHLKLIAASAQHLPRCQQLGRPSPGPQESVQQDSLVAWVSPNRRLVAERHIESPSPYNRVQAKGQP